jgi:hypothetical protein
MLWYLAAMSVEYAIAFGLALLLNAQIVARKFWRVAFLLPPVLLALLTSTHANTLPVMVAARPAARAQAGGRWRPLRGPPSHLWSWWACCLRAISSREWPPAR